MIRLRRLVAREFRQLVDVDLTFPRRGRVLVQGRNEAGKSTLFEAIFVALFGKPLDGKTLDECVQYGREQAWLELELELGGGRTMTVTRRIRATAARNRYELTIRAPDGAEETVQGAQVGERIEAELGLDGEALLNTCFVEQKKLEKLEGLGLREREHSLMKLLNLDRLVALADELKVTRADEADVQRLRDRLALADVQARLPILEAEHAAAAAAVARAEAAAAVAAAVAERRALDDLAAARAAAAAEAEIRAGRAAAAERLRQAMARLRDLSTARERARAAEADRDSAAAAQAAAAAARDALPAVAAHGARLATLGRRREALDGLAEERATLARWIEAADAQLRRLAEARDALNDTRRALVEARAAERDAAADAEAATHDGRAFDVREALRGWLAAVREGAAMASPDAGIAAARAERLAAERSARARVAAPAALGAGLAALSAYLWWAARPAAMAAVAIAAVACLVVAMRRAAADRARLAALDRAIARLEGEATVAEQRRALLAERRAAAEARLGELNAVVPANAARALDALGELDARLGDRSKADVAGALEAAREARARSAARIEALVRREAELRHLDGPVDAQALGQERAAKAARAARLERFVARATAHLARAAARLDVAPERAAVQEAVASLRGRWAAQKEQADRLPALAEAHGRWAAEAAARWSEAEAAYGDVAAALAGRAVPLPAWSTAHPDAVWSSLSITLADAYAADGGDAVREAHRAAAEAAAAAAARHDDAAARWRATVRALESRLAAIGEAPAAADAATGATAVDAAARAIDPTAGRADAAGPTAEALAARLPALGPAGAADLAVVVDRRDRAVRDIDVARHELARLASALGLRGEALDVAACREALDAAERALRTRAHGHRIVETAARNVVQQVLPATMDHMRRLLPTLTEGRYFDARLTDDYRIQVWDERAGAWQKKSLFSGGTKDQLSLALRLSFAMATLPEERGTAPSFLFLDEPLGAFDEARADALVHLLTEGEVAEAFDQIFLISHVRVDPRLFDHRIVVDGGRVVEGLGEAAGRREDDVDVVTEG